MKVGVVINQHTSAGRDSAIAKEIRSGFAENGIDADVRLSPSKHLSTTASELLEEKVDALVAGGGDGTVSTIAEVCAKHRLPLGIIPLGTRNHFGRDLGIPRSTAESILCIARARPSKVDLGSVNDRYFINNSSIGAYPRAVEEREELRYRFLLRKFLAGMVATLRTFAQRPIVDATIELDGSTFRASGPFVFVGNNLYSVKLLSVSHRASVSEGQLCIYTARCNGVSGLFHLLWLSLWGRLEQSRHFEMRTGTEAIVRLPKSQARVSKDGEVFRMATPLHYQIQPCALEVFTTKP
jgi:diacylglycerol kinase family enzyme